jgi:hypothetical protein
MDEFWTLTKSWIPFIILMAIWFFFVRGPVMRRLIDWMRARQQRKDEDRHKF